MTSKKDMYWCDHCGVEKINGMGKIEFCYFACNAKHDYIRHIKRKKHIKNVEKKEEILCKHCGETFTQAGYKIHKERNEELWRYKSFSRRAKKMTCNHFVCPDSGKRYSCWLAFKYETEDTQKINRIIERQNTISSDEEDSSSGDDTETSD